MKKITALLTSLFYICLVSTTTIAQFYSQKIDSLMAEGLIKFKVAGASIAIVKDGKVIHSKSYGVANINTQKPVNLNTSFQIAPNCKAFTSTALALLEEEGKLKWTDKVKVHIPNLKCTMIM